MNSMITRIFAKEFTKKDDLKNKIHTTLQINKKKGGCLNCFAWNTFEGNKINNEDRVFLNLDF